MNYNHLNYFYWTAKYQNVSLAAEQLRISQPSLSAQMKTFEKSLNTTLIKRKGRNIVLTPEGEKIFIYCQQIFGLTDELLLSLKNKELNVNKKIRVGISNQIEQTYAADLLSPIISQMSDKNITFSVNSENDNELIHNFQLENLDMLLMNKPIYGEGHEVLREYDMPVVLLGSGRIVDKLNKIPSSNMSFQNILEMLNADWVFPDEKLRLRTEIDTFIQKFKSSKSLVFEADSLSIVARAIVDGVGYGFLPLPYVEEELKSGSLKIIGPKKGFWTHKLFVKVRNEFLKKSISVNI